MLQVFPCSDFKQLLAHAVRWLSQLQPSLQPTPLIVPSLAFRDALQLGFARSLGVTMGIEFLMPQRFIRRVAQQEEHPWAAEHLLWGILEQLDPVAQALNLTLPTSRDRLALATTIADRLDRYGHYRPHLVRSWMQSSPPPTEWQAALWHSLHQRLGVPHPALALSTATPHSSQRIPYPRDALIIANGTLDPLLLEALQLLSQHGSRLLLLSILPSLGFLGDLRRHHTLPSIDSDPESIELPATHPLLASMARDAVGTFLQLGELDENYTHWQPSPPPDSSTASAPLNLLQQLQADIRSQSPPTPSPHPDPTKDLSLRIHSCFGPRREIEVLRDELLRAFADFPDLQPEHIHLIAPDLSLYAPFVTALLLNGSPPLPVRLTEARTIEINPQLQALTRLLEISASARFEASTLIALLQLPAIQTLLNPNDDSQTAEQLLSWVRLSGCVQGLHNDNGSWQAALDRMIAGHWFGSINLEENCGLHYPDASPLLPIVETLHGNEPHRAAFLHWWSRLIPTLHQWSSQESPPKTWFERLAHATKNLLGGSQEEQAEALAALRPLHNVACTTAISAGAILDWLNNTLHISNRRSALAGSIRFGKFRHLHNLPCRVLAIVGMSEGSFPSRNDQPSWDLMRLHPKIWDRNRRVEDRQMFLDSLLAPTDRLIITAPNRNILTGRTAPASTCVEELLRTLDLMHIPRDAALTLHRLQPFASDYFQTPSSLPHSFDTHAAQVATSLHHHAQGSPQPLLAPSLPSTPTPPLPPPPPPELPLERLIRFWQDPARALLESHGLITRDPANEDGDEQLLDRFPLDQTGLNRWNNRRSILQRDPTSPDKQQHLQNLATLSRRLPPNTLGRASWYQTHHSLTPLLDCLRQHRGEMLTASLSLPNASLLGSVQRTRTGNGLLFWHPSEIKKIKHRLAAWIQTLFLTAALNTDCHALLLEPHARPKTAPLISPDAARQHLALLIAAYHLGQHQPLRFSPEASARLLDNKSSEQTWSLLRTQWQQALDNANNAAASYNTDLFTPSDLRLWRNTDPFANRAEWDSHAQEILAPLNAWFPKSTDKT